ncbi:GNAT family N-acetyltransferase [Kordiimonas gwangyangensis]|uniref:GNAT family N-acetyltransferase n=1 Tax=Kordiimonas gwangyangensis TaxID=288022 RepID=UPI0012DD4972|nr:GNAT family N-acetyltransferase [Kordiimonas gwangyangensis]
MTDILPIETDRLIIRAFRESDAEAFHSWRNDPVVVRYTLWDFPYLWRGQRSSRGRWR